MRNQNTQIAYKDLSWFTSNAEIILKTGMQIFYLQTGLYKVGDGITKLSELYWLGGLFPVPVPVPVYYYLVGDLDYWGFNNPNENNNIDLGTFLSPLDNFFLDWLRF